MDKQFDVVIVGTGVAGLYGALKYPEDVSVLLLSKKELTLSNSSFAQGGVAAVLDKNHDNYKLHIADTLIAGKYKNNLSAVEKLVTEGPDDVLKLKELGVFGNDYDTHDGTGVRDYIHVVDLALGHVKAIEKLNDNPGIAIYNLGTGNGYSVLDIVKNFEAATGIHIPYVIKERRPGDIATCYCDAGKAERELHWKAERDLKTMCADSWRWQKNNPNGYDD